jgi:hypothetical protein
LCNQLHGANGGQSHQPAALWNMRLLDQVFDEPRAAANGNARASKTFDF